MKPTPTTLNAPTGAVPAFSLAAIGVPLYDAIPVDPSAAVVFIRWDTNAELGGFVEQLQEAVRTRAERDPSQRLPLFVVLPPGAEVEQLSEAAMNDLGWYREAQ